MSSMTEQVKPLRLRWFDIMYDFMFKGSKETADVNLKLWPRFHDPD